MPLMYGSTTPREAATAASKALPPSSRTSRPARVASGWAELTIPFVPTAARLGVLLLARPSRGSDPPTAVAGSGSTAVSPSAGFVPGDEVCSGTSPSAEVCPAVLPPGEPPPVAESPSQEQSTNTTNATRNGFFTRLPRCGVLGVFVPQTSQQRLTHRETRPLETEPLVETQGALPLPPASQRHVLAPLPAGEAFEVLHQRRAVPLRPHARRRDEVVHVQVALVVKVGEDLDPGHGGHLAIIPHGEHAVAVRHHLREQLRVLPLVQFAV